MKVQGPLLGWTVGLGAVAMLVLTVSYGYSREPGSRLRQFTSAPASGASVNVKRGSRGSAILGTPAQGRANSRRIRFDTLAD